MKTTSGLKDPGNGGEYGEVDNGYCQLCCTVEGGEFEIEYFDCASGPDKKKKIEILVA